jgi:hypothetical protein
VYLILIKQKLLFMKKIANIFLILFSIILLQNCEDTNLPSFNYVTFSESTYSTGVDVGGSTTIDVTVYTAEILGSARTFNIVVDPSSNAAAGSYVVPSSVSVPSGSNEGTLTVALSDVDLGIGVNRLILNFASEEGFFYGSSTAVEYTQNCEEITAVLDFIFDFWASETGWYIEDSLGGTVVSGGGYSNGEAPTSENITLCAGRDYTLYVTDAYGDGMNDGATLGSYTLTINGVVKASGGGSFGSSESTEFDTN